ncbi:ABC transporter permease subunit [Rubrobacter tropicus]|uniref:ABC transporter permease subunit n=1 Tax=Rubrobacter tropicus TaxID=2653851 RepID=A0A6G8QAM3_9ACTN|nr:carbohydrate ABC transporter permease [Rubrobacter tropicus]QIN83478.1 ABC transporter permease subunit [Rubrobacter tropicus]
MAPTTNKGGGPGAGLSTRVITTALLGVFLVYSLLPLFYLVVSATKDNDELFTSFGLWFSSFDLPANLRETFTRDDGVYLNWLWNTAYYSVTSAVGAAFISTIAGYAFAKYRFPGRIPLFAVILGSIMIPQTALVIPTYLLLSKIGLIDTPLAVILPSLVSPFGVYLMRVYAEQSVPDDLLNAARVDGAGELRIFWSVALRVLMPGFVTVLLLSFVATWNNYFLPLVVLSTPELYPLTVGLASWNSIASAGGGAQPLFPLVITGALVSILPIVVSFLFLQRFWQGGLTFGALKD